VKVFELLNEPNDWSGGSSALVPAKYFAKFLQVVYESKYYGKWNDVKLVSGPLFTHDGDNGYQYIYDTYTSGMNDWAWDWFHANAGTYPLDALGLHLYVAQGTSDKNIVTSKINANVRAFWQGVQDGENYRGLEPSVNKSIWISEIGWERSAVGDDGQAWALNTAVTLLSNYWMVKTVLWFNLQDFGSSTWGLIDNAGNKHASWNAFVQVAAKYRLEASMETYCVAANPGLYLRSSPCMRENNILTIPNGDFVNVIQSVSECGHKWSEVAYSVGPNTYSGYVMSNYLQPCASKLQYNLNTTQVLTGPIFG